MVLDLRESFPSLTKLLTIPLKNKRHVVLKKLACNRVSEKCELEETMTNLLSYILSITVHHAYFVHDAYFHHATLCFSVTIVVFESLGKC